MNGLIFVLVVCVMTFILVVLYKYGVRACPDPLACARH